MAPRHPRNVSLDHGEIAIRDSDGTGAGLSAVVGGRSWDHYRVSADVMVEAAPASATCTIQFRAIGSADSVSIGTPGALLRQLDREIGRQWNLMGGPQLPQGEWHSYEALFDEQGAGHFFNGRTVNYQQHVDWQRLPRLPHGPLEIIISAGGGAVVHLRHLRIKFLRPTETQLGELESNAKANLKH